MPRAPKPCGHHGCTRLVTARRYCTEHQRPYQQRSNTTARGYGWQHQQARTAALATYTPNQPCARCGRPLQPGQPLHLDHNTTRDGYIGLSHQRCNTHAAGRNRTGA